MARRVRLLASRPSATRADSRRGDPRARPLHSTPRRSDAWFSGGVRERIEQRAGRGPDAAREGERGEQSGTLLVRDLGGAREGEGLAVGQEEGFLRQLLEYLSLTSHLESFVRGILKLSDVVYYLSLAFVGLFLAHRVVEAQRWR